MKAAAIQMTSGRVVGRNLDEARRLIAEAADSGAELVVLPENFSFLGAQDAERLAVAEQPGKGAAQDFLAEQAEVHQLWLVGGTVPVSEEADRVRSRSIVFDPSGRCIAEYDKIHLFDVDVPDNETERYRESATTVSGSRPVTLDTPFGRIGMAVCYDLRFPALFHRLGKLGMEILVLPAAFTVPTGRVHWQPLLQARAIESLVYVVASGQWGEHADGRRTYGHSMILSPWGEILACQADGAGVVSVDLDMIKLGEIREQFPTLQHRQDL